MNKEAMQTIDKYFSNMGNDCKAITIIAGGQYEMRLRPNGSVIHNFDGGTWQPIGGDNYIMFEYDEWSSVIPCKIIIVDSIPEKIMYILYRPQIIVSFI